ARVVLMLVGDKNGVTAVETLARRTQASRSRFPAKARVHQQARLLRANPGGVASTAAAQHANSYAQETLPALLGRARWSHPTSGQTRPHYKAGGANRKSENSEPRSKTPSRGRAGCGMFSA